MRLVVGLLTLVLALALVGLLLRTQFNALRSGSEPSAASAAGGSPTSPAGGPTPAQASQRLQRKVADDIGKALEQGARRNEGEAER